VGDEVVYENPALKNGAGAQLAQSQIDTQGKDEAYYVARTKAQLDVMRSDRRQFDHNDDRYRRYYGGDHWFNKLRPAYKARPAPNYIFADIETIIAIMTDGDPNINIVAEKAEQARWADKMQAGVRSVFRKNKSRTLSVRVLKDTHMYGTGVVKTCYNPKTKSIDINFIDKRYFFVSPGATDIQSAARVGIAVNQFVSDMERDFPHLKGKISKGDVVDESLTHKPVDPQKLYEQDKAYVINSDTGDLQSASDGGSTDPSRKIATRIELWERDEEGQVWVTVVCGDQLARRSKSPYKNGLPTNPGGSKFPFSRCLNYPINSQFWGMGEVAQLESPQDMVNRSEAQIADLSRLCTSPYMLLHRTSRVSLKDITNRIASFIVWDGEKRPEWMPPPGVANELFRIVENSKAHMDNMSSVHDATRGELPADKISGVAIKALQKATTGRVALKTRMFEEFLVDVAGQVIDLIKQYFINTTVRVGQKYHQINVIDPKTQQVDPLTDVSLGEYEVEIGIGSTLPIDKGARNDQALQMFQLGAISRRTLLNRTGWTEDEIQRALKEFADEKLADADQQLKIQQLAAEMQNQVTPPPPDPNAQPAADSSGQAPADQGAAAPPPTSGSGSDDMAQIMQELQQLETAAPQK
jgi:hypothetical protein